MQSTQRGAHLARLASRPIRSGCCAVLAGCCAVLAGCQVTSVVPPKRVESARGPDAAALTRSEVLTDRSYAIPQTVAPSSDGVPLSYTFIEAGAINGNVDSIGSSAASDVDIDSFYGRGSLGLGLLHVFAGYENQDLDLSNTTSDLFRLGGGAHIELTDRLHAVGEIAWLFNDVSSNLQGFSDSNSGYELKAGARWMAMEWSAGGLELAGNLVWVDLKNRIASDDEAFGWEGGLRIHLLEALSAGATYSILEDDDQIAVSARLSF